MSDETIWWIVEFCRKNNPTKHWKFYSIECDKFSDVDKLIRQRNETSHLFEYRKRKFVAAEKESDDAR